MTCEFKPCVQYAYVVQLTSIEMKSMWIYESRDPL